LPAALLVVLALGGCTGSFPYTKSMDRHIFDSSTHMPKRVELKDTVTGQIVWSLNVPAGQSVVIDLDHDAKWTAGLHGAKPADQIRWQVVTAEPAYDDELANTQELNGNPVILQVKIIDLAEAPPSSAASGP
ncbi:MAG: hypothetical protein OER86_03215, partial [Phycisphaerae bacterium]|nr:hypothetical protein [Phycisphaerae bacterium]